MDKIVNRLSMIYKYLPKKNVKLNTYLNNNKKKPPLTERKRIIDKRK